MGGPERNLDENLPSPYITAMKATSWSARGVSIVALRVVIVVIAVGALGGWAGPQAVDAHDNILLLVGVACFGAAGLTVIFGGLWIAASVRDLLGDRTFRQ
jgi:hypothetical protein